MLKINKKAQNQVAQVWQTFGESIKLPAKSSWKKKTDDEIWQRVVSQVVVVGGVGGMSRMTPDLKKQIAWDRLVSLSEKRAVNQIWRVLSAVGARYVGKQDLTCRKSHALYKNLRYLESVGGPKIFLATIAAAKTPDAKIDLVRNHLAYIKSKGARDFLTSGFGLLSESIALDVRVLGALTHLGVEGLPKSTPADVLQYTQIEQEILEGICKPAGISGAQLDQLLFKNYDAILGRV